MWNNNNIFCIIENNIPNKAGRVNCFVLTTAGSEKAVLMKINFMLINKKLIFSEEKT